MQDPILIARNAGASLSAPVKADIARKRKLPVNKGKYEQRESKATASTTAWDRLKEFPNHHFALIDRKLRWDACSEELSMKKSSIKKYIESRKHKNGLSDIRKHATTLLWHACKGEIREKMHLQSRTKPSATLVTFYQNCQKHVINLKKSPLAPLNRC